MENVAIDVEHLERQLEWSTRTFGPGARSEGVIQHILKELREIAEDPSDLDEWVDVIILSLDGAMRAGHSPQEVIERVKWKQSVNENRQWPDWRQFTESVAIEHVR